MAQFPALQSSYAAGEVTPALRARVDLAKYRVGLQRQHNMFSVVHGGSVNRPGTMHVDWTGNSDFRARLVPFKYATTDTYVLEFGGNGFMRVIRNGGYVLGTTKAISAITNANPAQLTINAHGWVTGTRIFIDGVNGMTQINGSSFFITVLDGNTLTINADSSAWGVYASAGTASDYYGISLPYAEAHLRDLNIVQSFDKMRITHPSYPAKYLTRTDHDAWTLTDVTYAPTIAAPSGLLSDAPGTAYFYQITAVADETGEESLPAGVGSSTQTSTITFTPVTGANNYNVYKLDPQGVYGFIGRALASPGRFTDDTIESDGSITPPSARDPFAGGKYPAVSTYWEQRSIYGGPSAARQTVYTSVAGAFDNMSVSQPTQDDDAITKTLNARSVNAIRGMVPFDDLLVFTSGGLWKGATTTGVVSPATLAFKQQTNDPISSLEPLIVGDDVLFSHETGSIVYRVSFEAISTKWRPTNVSVLSSHFFKSAGIVEWCYAQVPFNLIWAVRSDGALLSFTYLKEQEVYAWALHDVGGEVESICTVPEGSEDAVYMIVKRGALRFVERLASRSFSDLAHCWFLDRALRYDGAPASVIGNLYHLNGETVTALADGVVVRDLVVSNGTVTLPAAASVVLIGKGYDSEMQTLGVETQPTVQGRPRRVTAATLHVEASRGGQVGPDFDNLSNMPYLDQLGDPGTAREAFTGETRTVINPDWDTGGSVCIRQRDPYPLSVLTDVLETAVG